MFIKPTSQTLHEIRPVFDHRSKCKVIALIVYGTFSTVSFAQTTNNANYDDTVGIVDEIIVTASKRQQSFQDFSGSVSVIANPKNYSNIETIAGRVPGFSLVETGPRNPTSIVIRGLRADAVGSNDFGGDGGTVASYVDNIPLQGYFVPPTFSLKDLQQIEVLRGPQGTLYGNSSIGGLIRYVTAKPDLAATSIDINAALSQTSESNDLNNDTDMVANVPLITNILGIRLLLGKEKNAGFIDNPYLLSGPANDINDDKTEQARLSGLWKPVTEFSLAGSYHYQKSYAGDRQATNKFFTDDDYTATNKYAQPMQGELRLSGLDADYQMSWATLSASINQYDYKNKTRADQTDYLLTLDSIYQWNYYSSYSDFSAYTAADIDVNKGSGEIRFVSPKEQSLRWLGGAFYSQDKLALVLADFVPGFADFTGEERPRDLDYYATQDETLEEQSIYAEVAYDLQPRWEIAIGARYSNLTDDVRVCSLLFPTAENFSGNNYPVDCMTGKNNQSTTLKKISTRYLLPAGNSLYFTINEGFRRGGANALPVEITHNRFYKPDTATNYEVGTHSYFFEKKIQLSGAIFYIDWENVQVSSVLDEGYSAYMNAKSARSTGVEVELKTSIFSNWLLHSGFSLTDAELSEDVSNINGGGENVYAGNRLPGSPRYQINFGADYYYQIRSAQLNAGFTIARNGSSYTALNSEFADYDELSGYNLINAHVDVSMRNWRAGIFMNNVTNTRGITGKRTAQLFGDAGKFEYITRPRTIGVSASYHF